MVYISDGTTEICGSSFVVVEGGMAGGRDRRALTFHTSILQMIFF